MAITKAVAVVIVEAGQRFEVEAPFAIMSLFADVCLRWKSRRRLCGSRLEDM